MHTLRSILSWKYKLEKTEGEIKNEQSREKKLATLGMQDTGRRPSTQKTQYRKLGKWAIQTPPTCEGQAVPVYHRTPAMLLIYVYDTAIGKQTNLTQIRHARS